MQKRNKTVSRLVFPFGVFVWLIGWCLCLTGEKKATRTKPNVKIR
jgi:hypothetical protein